MKDHERFVIKESILIFFSTYSKIKNSVVPQLLSMNY